MNQKFEIEIKEHKVEFVLDLLKNMPFVTVTPLTTKTEKTPESQG